MAWVVCSEKTCPDCGARLDVETQVRRPRWWARRVDASAWCTFEKKPDDWRGRTTPLFVCPEGHGRMVLEREAERVPRGVAARGADSPRPVDPSTVTVYVAPSGTRYHDAGCGLLQGRGRAVRLSEALAHGMMPCQLYGPGR